MFQTTCPWWLVHFSVAVGQVADAYQWAERGDLTSWWGSPPPIILWDAIQQFHRGVKRGEHEYIERAKADL